MKLTAFLPALLASGGFIAVTGAYAPVHAFGLYLGDTTDIYSDSNILLGSGGSQSSNSPKTGASSFIDFDFTQSGSDVLLTLGITNTTGQATDPLGNALTPFGAGATVPKAKRMKTKMKIKTKTKMKTMRKRATHATPARLGTTMTTMMTTKILAKKIGMMSI